MQNISSDAVANKQTTCFDDRMLLLYLKYPKCQTLSGKLSWSHFAELLSVSDDLSRSFYEKQCINENWSIRELKRQRQTGLFERLAMSKDKAGVLELAQKGQLIEFATDIVKDPYIFEFLQMPELVRYSERDLEKRQWLLSNLALEI
jgi:predicted nuclease of restriction endonuclease-like (RecB) superfamily